jgi:nucleoside 2-deoxyribosyltransferase
VKKTYRIFCAIPYDSLIKETYEKISNELQSYFQEKGLELIFTLGNQYIGLSPAYSSIESFKMQNADLQEQFLKQVRESDIIIADLTNNNPNVHFELGIALYLNKNILRVTGRDLKELGFDIQNLEVFKYNNCQELSDKIIEYLNNFSKIKTLDFSPQFGNLYQSFHGPQTVGDESPKTGIIHWAEVTNLVFKDGAVKLKFRFLNFLNQEAWFGIYFRAEQLPGPLILGQLIYLRKNGRLELATYDPFQKSFISSGVRTIEASLLNDWIDLLMQIDGSYLEVELQKQKFYFEKSLNIQKPGKIWVATFESKAEFKDLELINRDTISMG